MNKVKAVSKKVGIATVRCIFLLSLLPVLVVAGVVAIVAFTFDLSTDSMRGQL